MTNLDYDTIQQLLKEGSSPTTRSSSPKSVATPFERPVSIGPLRYRSEEIKKCVSKGCGVSSLIEVKGIPLCSSHAINELNRLLLDAYGIDYSDCNCKAGFYSKMNIHTEGCPVWIRTKEQRDNSNTGDSAEGIDPS